MPDVAEAHRQTGDSERTHAAQHSPDNEGGAHGSRRGLRRRSAPTSGARSGTSSQQAPVLLDVATASATAAERRVALLRLIALPLIVFGRSLPPADLSTPTFIAVVAVCTVASFVILARVFTRPVTPRFSMLATAGDVIAITLLALLSGGPFSEARVAFFLVPVAVAFRFRPIVTATAAAAVVVAYLVEALFYPPAELPNELRFTLLQTGFLAWIGLAATLLSAVLARQTDRLTELYRSRSRLLADALGAEERERQALAEALHDHAIQNLLAARLDLEEFAPGGSGQELDRAESAIATTIAELREAVFDLHPYVLEHAGLVAALRGLAARASRHGKLSLHLDLCDAPRSEHDQLLYSAARELLTNVVKHARARNAWLRLSREQRDITLSVSDDGTGFNPQTLDDRIAKGHIGLATQRERVESAGGRLQLKSTPDAGTSVEINLPISPGA